VERINNWGGGDLFFTNPLDMLETMKRVADMGTFQLEVAPATAALHFQGWIARKAPRLISSWHNKLGAGYWLTKMKGSHKDNQVYCTKLDSRLAVGACPLLDKFIGPFTWGDVPKIAPMPKAVANPRDSIEKLYTYQEDVLHMLESPPDSRKIQWYWEGGREGCPRGGNVGKSALCKIIVLEKAALYMSGAKEGCICAVADWINGDAERKVDPKPLDVVIFDIPRCNVGGVSYSAIEGIANGMVFNAKYHSGMAVFNRPHIVVFANTPPNWEKLSDDRWEVCEIVPGEDKDFVLHPTPVPADVGVVANLDGKPVYPPGDIRNYNKFD